MLPRKSTFLIFAIIFIILGNILYNNKDGKTDIMLIDYDYSSYNFR